METKDNPLVAFTLQFQDGCQLGLRMDHLVPQVEAMEALGKFAARVGTELDITLPVQPMELVAEAIECFLAAQGNGETFPRELREWSSHDMAKALLDAVMLPEPEEMVDACRVAAQAIRDDLPHVALLPLEAAIGNYEKNRSRTDSAEKQ